MHSSNLLISQLIESKEEDGKKEICKDNMKLFPYWLLI